MSSQTWPPARVHELKRLFKDGVSHGETAKSLNASYPHLPKVSRNSVAGKLFRMGLIRSTDCNAITNKEHGRSLFVTRWTKERDEQLKRLLPELTYPALATRFGVEVNAIKRRIARLGLAAKRGSPEHIARLMASRGTSPKAKKPKPQRYATPEPESLCLDLMQLRADTCRWPSEEPYTFCGNQVEPEKPYCPHHCSRAYGAQPEKYKGGGAVAFARKAA